MFETLRRNFRELEKKFWLYYRIQKAIVEAKEERNIYLKDIPYKKGGDPTLERVLEAEEPITSVIISLPDDHDVEIIKNPETWVSVVEHTLEFFKENDPVVYEVIYRRYIKNEGFPNTCIDLDVPEGNYYKARDVGLQYARECAIQLGLLKAF